MYKITVFLLLLPLSVLFGQNEKGMLNVQTSNIGASSQFVESLPVKKKATTGTNYYQDYWSRGSVTLNNGQVIDDKRLMYDLQNNIIELNFDGKVFIVTTKEVEQFEWFDERKNEKFHFINSKKFVFENEKPKISTFSRLLVEGEIGLISITKTKLIKANYNATLDVGEKGDKIVHEKKLFLTIDNRALMIPNSKKKFVELFSGKESEIKQYIKSKKIDHKELPDLLITIGHYKTLL